MVHKVLAYITRQRAGQTELLVFHHRDHPEAGTQVPAGTVAPGEAPEQALWREIGEEAGLTGAHLRLVGRVAEQPIAAPPRVRRVYHLTAEVALPDQWTHTVTSADADHGLVFEFFWTDLSAPLAGDQAAWLPQLRAAG